MNKSLFTIFLIIAALSPLRAQSNAVADSTGGQNKTSQLKLEYEKQPTAKEFEKHEVRLKGFIDENGDGIDDRIEHMQGKGVSKMNEMMKQMMKNQMHDQFIDMDGDGINDNRCGGMGIMQKGKKSGGKKP